jgi:hypothetical protein
MIERHNKFFGVRWHAVHKYFVERLDLILMYERISLTLEKI